MSGGTERNPNRIKQKTYEQNGFRDEQISSKNPVEELYIEPNPTEEEVEEQIRVMEKLEWAIDEAEARTTKKITHKWFSEDSIVQQYVQYAYEKWWMDLVLLIECENGNRDIYKQSEVVKNWKRERSFWLCQVHQPDHPEITDNKLFWNDWKWQLDRCNELMENGTPFYGRDRIIKGQKCSNYVKDRFILS